MNDIINRIEKIILLGNNESPSKSLKIINFANEEFLLL
jgi:hypothetical protein